MFFEISKIKNQNYPVNHELKNGIFLNCDLGWKKIEYKGCIIFFKGYILDNLTDNEFFENIIKNPMPTLNGNFFSIISGEEIVVTNDICRGSPLRYIQNKKVTNLEMEHTPVWSNKYLSIDYDLSVTEKTFSPYIPSYEPIEYDSALEQVHEILCNSFESFLSKNNKPLKVFLSGGIDTLTMYSYIKKFTNKFELIDYEYTKFTHFYKKNYNERLKKFWGYRQIHSWGQTPAVLLSGACGDEYFLRGPNMLAVLAQHHDIDVISTIEDDPMCYHYKYFQKEKNKKIFTTKQDIDTSSRKKTINYILNNLINDHQHWHLDETLCFTPFKNMTIPNIMLNLPKENIIEQIKEAQFNKDLILKNNPDDLKLLSTYKNYKQFENLIKI